MTYIPNPTQTTEPTADQPVESAAAEFRALKEYVSQVLPQAENAQQAAEAAAASASDDAQQAAIAAASAVAAQIDIQTNWQDKLAAAASAASTATTQAATATNQATIATTQATVAASSAATATAARLAAEAARDSSFANAKGAATIADARALVAVNETFIVYVGGAATFQAYRKTGTSTEVFLGEYPSASAAMLTSGNIFASLTPRAQVFNGAVLTTVAGRQVGFVIPVGQTGGNSYVIADIPATALRGKTVRLVQRYQASASWLADVVPLGSVFAQYRAGASFLLLTADNTSRTQTGTEIVQVGTVTVPNDADFIGLVMQVSSANVAETTEQTIQIVGVAYQVLSDANATQTVADTVLNQRLGWISPAIAAAVAPVTASVTALSARVDQNALTSGNLLGTAVGTQFGAEAFNGASISLSSGVPVGFLIPANAGTGNLTYITRFIGASSLVGKTVDFVAKYTTSENFSTLCPIRSTALQAVINGTLTTINVSAVTRTVEQNGTTLRVTVRYTVPAGTTDVGVIYQVDSSSATQATDRTISITSLSYQLAPPAGKTTNDVMADQRISDALAVALDGVAYSTAVINAGPGRTYTTPKAANDAVTAATTTNRTEIRLDAPATYSTDPEGWTLARFATLKGYGAGQPVISFAGADGDTHANSETFWVRQDATLENLKVTIRNGRYAIHAESGSPANAIKDAVVSVKNCWVEHLGNANNNWGTQSGWGSGIASGWKVRSEGNTYRGIYSGFFYHTNSNFDKPTLVENIGDTFTNTGSSVTGTALELQPMGSKQKDQHRLIGCTIDGTFMYNAYLWLYPTIDYQPANHCEIESSGYGNTPAVFRVSDFGQALRIRAIAGAGSSIAVSGDAVPVIFGTVRTFPGVENLPAYVDGSFDVSGVPVGAAQVNITSLGKRLGNCTSVNKTLTVTVNGGAPVSVVFNQDYTNIDNATIIASIQAAIGSTGTVVVDTYKPGELYHPRLTDEERTLQNNSSTVGIPKGSILAFDGTRKRIRLMTSTDAASLFAGVALEDIYPASFGRVKTRGWLWLPYIRSSAGSLTFGATMSVGATPGRVDAGGSQGLFRAVRTDAVEVAP